MNSHEKPCSTSRVYACLHQKRSFRKKREKRQKTGISMSDKTTTKPVFGKKLARNRYQNFVGN
jgi:hypothetical protein